MFDKILWKTIIYNCFELKMVRLVVETTIISSRSLSPMHVIRIMIASFFINMWFFLVGPRQTFFMFKAKPLLHSA